MAHGYETGRATNESPPGIRTRDDFGQYLLRVLGDYEDAGATEWENTRSSAFWVHSPPSRWRELTASPGKKRR